MRDAEKNKLNPRDPVWVDHLNATGNLADPHAEQECEVLRDAAEWTARYVRVARATVDAEGPTPPGFDRNPDLGLFSAGGDHPVYVPRPHIFKGEDGQLDAVQLRLRRQLPRRRRPAGSWSRRQTETVRRCRRVPQPSASRQTSEAGRSRAEADRARSELSAERAASVETHAAASREEAARTQADRGEAEASARRETSHDS